MQVAEITDMMKDLAESAAKKADVTYKVTRLRFRRSALAKLLDSQYKELGREVYKMCRQDGGDAEEIEAMAVRIERTHRRIDAIGQQIERVLEIVRCPVCGRVAKIKNPRCAYCGTQLAATEAEPEENETDFITSGEEIQL